MIEFLCALHLAFWMNCQTGPDSFVGFVEGEYVEVAPVTTARLNQLLVQRGDVLKAGDLIAVQESSDARSALSQAQANLEQAQAQLANLQLGKRPEEIAVIEAELSSARVALAQSERDKERLTQLSAAGQFVSASDLDQAITAQETAAANLQQIQANLEVAKLSAREDEIKSASASVALARAQLENAKWLLSEREIYAPAEGLVTQILKRAGETSGPSAPVIQLLPDNGRLVTFFVPEALRSGLQLGQSVELDCSGCEPPTDVVITYLGQEVEYSPPVIYSADRRQELVYRVEARSGSNSLQLAPGQIVDVLLKTAE